MKLLQTTIEQATMECPHPLVYGYGPGAHLERAKP
jgi:hypothetical protein